MIQQSSTQPLGVLWDMDGTLLDSAQYHWLAWRDVLASEGHDLTHEQFTAAFGQRNDTILRSYFGEDISLRDIKRISAAKEARYRHLVRAHGIELLPGAQRWLKYLQTEGWRQAIASSAPLLNIEVIVEILAIRHFFTALVSAEDVEHGKPDPQTFLVAADKLGIPPARCIVVEDAPVGIEAARRAGIRSIGVCSTHTTLQAECVVQTLDMLPDHAFYQLLNE